MRKKWPIFLAGALILAGGGAYGGYHYFFNRDIAPEEVHVNEDFFDFSKVIEEPASPAGNDGAPNADANDQPSLKEQAQEQQNATDVESRPSSMASKDGQLQTEEAIRAKYYPRFQRLQSEAVARLNQLAKNALADYQKSKKTGEPSLSEIAAKYTSAAKKLEGGVDAAFYRLLDQMKNDLQTAGLPLDLAEEAERTYKAQIEQKKAELWSKALGK
ncbi:hypothetical protein BSNK01_17900 [Bacillaceae bacterium]